MKNRSVSGYLLACLLASNITVADDSLPDPLAAGWQGKPVCERLHEDQTQRVLRCTFAPGVGHEKHYHKPHFGYALAGGKMRLIDASGTREVVLATDTDFSSGGTAWHSVLNVGDSTVVYLIVEPKVGVGSIDPE